MLIYARSSGEWGYVEELPEDDKMYAMPIGVHETIILDADTVLGRRISQLEDDEVRSNDRTPTAVPLQGLAYGLSFLMWFAFMLFMYACARETGYVPNMHWIYWTLEALLTVAMVYIVVWGISRNIKDRMED